MPFRQEKVSFKLRAKTKEIALIKNWSEDERREAEKQILTEEKQQQQQLIYLTYSLLALIISLMIALIFYYRKRVADNKLLQITNGKLKELHGVKDKLFSLIAHDLRNPMAAFMSMMQLLTSRKIDPEKQSAMLKEVSKRASETYSLLNNLLFWSKSQMGGLNPNPQCFEIRERSDAVIHQMQQQSDNKGIILENSIPEQQILADPDMIDVVIRNLVSNAIKYSHEGDTVMLSGTVKGDFFEISVNDHGIGIPEEVQQTLFRLTETASRRGTVNETGSGLGLVLCADFVRLNGGSIRFESIQGEGSTFYFTIPLKLAH